jgi:hypothetical protein
MAPASRAFANGLTVFSFAIVDSKNVLALRDV